MNFILPKYFIILIQEKKGKKLQNIFKKQMKYI